MKVESFAQIESAWAVLAGICSAIILLGGTVAVMVKLIQWIRKPTKDNTEALGTVNTYLASDKRRIEALERQQGRHDEEITLVLLAVSALMSHELDGNHTAQLEETRDKIQIYLFKSRGEVGK